MPPSQSWSCTPSEFSFLVSQVSQGGGKIVYISGSVYSGSFNPPSHPEVTLGFVYNGTDTLVLTILHESFFEIAPEIWAALAPYLPQAAS